MNTMIRLTAVLIILNIFMYIGVNFSMSADGENRLNRDYNFRFNGDLIDIVLGGNSNLNTITNDTIGGWTSYGLVINDSFSTIPEQQGGVVQEQGVNFLDSLKIIWSFILTLGNIAISPLTLFFNFRMPVFIGLMIGIPYFFIFLMTIIALIRGVGD